jgi:hypothetical protein
MLQTYVSSVSDVSEVCCKCFHVDVAKVDRDVAACCKCLFIVFHLFQTYITSVFYLNVVYVSHIYCKSMFQIF